jgi:hypothetical protein
MLPWLNISQFLGMNTLRKSNEIQRGEAAYALNSDHSTSSAVGPLEGYSLMGNQTNTDHVITKQFTYERGDGFKISVQVRDDGTNSYLEYLNTDDSRNSQLGEWLILVSGLATAVRSNGTVNRQNLMGITAFNDTGTDNMLFCNGTQNFSQWSGAVCVSDGAITAAAATITVKSISGDPATNPTDRFPSTGSFTYRNTAGTYTTVTYTGKTSTTFTGCSGATASADETGIAEAADTSTYSSVPKNNILDTAQGRVVAAGRSDAPNQWSVSRVSDFTDWTTSTTPDDAQSIDFPEGGVSTALAHIDQWFFYSKESVIWAITYQITQVSDGAGGFIDAAQSVKKRIASIGAVNQKAITNVNDDIWFLSLDGQLRRLFRLEGEQGFQTEDLNEIIRPTLDGWEFEDAVLQYWETERMIISAGRSSSDVPINDKGIIYQLSRNLDGSQVLNRTVHDWFIGDAHVRDKQLYFGSSVESRTFKAFDGFSKNGAPYDWKRIERIEVFPELGGHFNRKYVQFLGVTGLIATGTQLDISLAYDFNGSTATQEMNLLGTDEDYIVSQPLNQLNSFQLNTEPLNGTRDSIPDMNPFFVVFALPNEYTPYNIQLTFSTSGVGQDCEIDAYGWVVHDADQAPDKLKGQ